LGEYRNQKVVNTEFTLVKGYQEGKKGNYITVKNEGQFPIAIDVVKVKVNNIHDVDFHGKPVTADTEITTQHADTHHHETDEEAMARIATRFEILDEMSKACINGDIRAMIVTGPPGVGKSHGVTLQMNKASMFDKLSGKNARFEIVKGTMSAIGLFALLYKYSDRKNVLVFDDCDIWEDQDAINILKGALDSGKTRRISYNKDSRLLRDEGVPNTFEFRGSIIFITNKCFDNNKRSTKIQPHLDALQSRSHFLDLTINTERDKMLRIKQVHRDAEGGLFAEYDFENNEAEMILDFMVEQKSHLRELSLRMALKIADLVKISPKNWKVLAESTVMKRA
jgi:hypothetical protein